GARRSEASGFVTTCFVLRDEHPLFSSRSTKLGTSPPWSCLAAKKQPGESVLGRRRGNNAVLGSSVFDHRSRRSGFGLWRYRWCIGWAPNDLILSIFCT